MSQSNNQERSKKRQPLVSSLLLNRDISRSALLQQEDLDICVASMEMLIFRSIYLLVQVSKYPRRHVLELWHRVVSGSIGNRLLYRGTPLEIPEAEEIPEETVGLKSIPVVPEEDEDIDVDDEDEKSTKLISSSDAWKRLAEQHFMSYGAVVLKSSLKTQSPDTFIRLLRSLNLSREMYTQIITDALALTEDDVYGDYCGLAERAAYLRCLDDPAETEINELIEVTRRIYAIEKSLDADPAYLYGVLKVIKSYYAQHESYAKVISTAYLRLVVKNAQQRKVAGESQSPGDDRQNGVFGLIRAVRMYDHRTGARFATYAGYWIRQAIRFQAKLQINMIRQPKSLWDSYNRVERARRLLNKQNKGGDKSQITYAAIASETSLSVKQIEKIYTRVKTAQVRSLDFSMEGHETETFTLKDVTPLDIQEETVEEVPEKVLDRISQLLQRLPEEEAKVIALRYGLLDHLVGDDLDVNSIMRERIRQILAASRQQTQE